MKIILVQKVASLGNRGDIKEVAEGYARNFLIPSGLATLFEEGLAQTLKGQKEKEFSQKRKNNKKEEEKVHLLQGKIFSFSTRANEQGHLFAQIAPRQIAEIVREQQIDILEKYIVLDEVIKSVGQFQVHYRPSKNCEAIFFLHVLSAK